MGRVGLKQNLRKSILLYRTQLDEVVYAARNEKIQNLCLDFMLQLQIQSFHTYLAIPKNKEPKTNQIIGESLALGREILVSRTDLKNHQMLHYLFDPKIDLVSNNYGIPEPSSGIKKTLKGVDALIIPLLAIDKKGNRIGYGAGYYDELLSELGGAKAHKIGLCLSAPLDFIPFAESHDVPLDFCITPNNIYKFS